MLCLSAGRCEVLSRSSSVSVPGSSPWSPLFPGYLLPSMIARPWTRTSSFRYSPVIIRSRSTMAQHANGPLASVAPEEFSTSVPPTAAASPSCHAFHYWLHDDPLHSMGEPQVLAGLEPVTDSVMVTATWALDTPPLVSSLGFPFLGTQPAVATSVVGSIPLGSFALVPPSTTIPLRLGSLVDESSTMQAQHVWATAQRLQGMALSSGPVPYFLILS